MTTPTRYNRLIDSNEFEDQKWDPYSDICAIKAFQRTNNAVKKVRFWTLRDRLKIPPYPLPLRTMSMLLRCGGCGWFVIQC